MCLAIPAKVTALISESRAMVDIGGVSKEISLMLVDNIQAGDYVIIHVGYALTKLSEAEAQKTLQLISEIV